MLTREGFVVADMSASTPWQRSSWKAEAIRRGDLKISGPIPITEDMPLNDEEERDFAEKAGLNSPTQIQEDALETPVQRPATPPQPSEPPPSITEHMSALRSNPVDGPLQQREETSDWSPLVSPPRMRPVPETQPQSIVHSTEHPSPTPFRSTPESAGKAAQKNKRKSGLRNVFRKIFSRKSRDEADDLNETSAPRGHSYHHSVCKIIVRIHLS